MDLIVEDVDIPGPDGAPPVRLRLYRSKAARGTIPALLWVHGGGMVLGDELQDAEANTTMARSLGILVVSVRYRLAPDDPAPAAIEDVYAALLWLHRNADELNVDPGLVAIGGASAGGGIAAGTTLMAHDREEAPVAFQLLVYPMLDDRTVTRTDLDTTRVRVWTPASNRYGWSAYLGREPGGTDVSPYAAPARRTDLSGLPPAWIGVGSLDLFRDEDVHYAERLRAAGVACAVEIVPGAFHGFDALFRRTGVARSFLESQVAALRGALRPDLEESGAD